LHLPYGRLDRLALKGLKLASRSLYEDGTACLKKTIDAGSKDSRNMLQYGLALAELGRGAESEEAVGAALESSDDKSIYYLFLGIIQLDNRKFEEACASLEESLRIDPNNRLAASYAALASWENGKQDEAMKMLLEKSQVQSTAFEARLLIKVEEISNGILPYDYLEKTDDSTGFFGRIFKRFMSWRKSKLMQKAEVQKRKEKYEKALDTLEKAVYTTGCDKALSESIAGVRKKYQKELLRREKKEGRDLDRLFKLGSLYYDGNDYQAAEEYLEKWFVGAKEAKGKGVGQWMEFFALRMLADIRIATNKLKKAEQQLAELNKLDAHDPFNYYLSGKLKLKQGDRIGAITAFRSFIDRTPDFARMRLRAFALKETE